MNPHQTVRHAESACGADGLPCDLPPGPADLLPCAWCPRGIRGAAAALPGLRLGAVERAVLVAAPEPDAGPALVWPPGVARPSIRRAVGKLRSAGLLVTLLAPARGLRRRVVRRSAVPGGPPTLAPRRGVVVQLAVNLTPLGSAVRARFRSELEGGGRIRWAGWADVERLVSELGESPGDLWDRWDAARSWRRSELKAKVRALLADRVRPSRALLEELGALMGLGDE